MENWNWWNPSLHDDPARLKSMVTVLNFCGLPTNPVDYRNGVDMQKNLANSQREEVLGQWLEHSRPKNVDFFIRGQQTNLQDLTNILENSASTECL